MRFALAALVSACCLFGAARAENAPARVLLAFRAGELVRAGAIADSVVREDPSDLRAAWMGARSAEARGELDAAHCRYLELERVDPKGRVGQLAAYWRRELERRAADDLADPASSSRSTSAPVSSRDRVLLLPLENLGEPEPGVGFGFAWSLLLFQELAGSELCPVGIPTMLAAIDLASGERARRAPAEIERLPVNSVRGLEARLRVLPGPEGAPYLAGTHADTTDARKQALLAFQRDRGLITTGEANRETQRALGAAIETWVEEPPSALAPENVSSAMELARAGLALRGTYAIEGARVRVQYSWIDAEGREAVASTARTLELDAALLEARRAAGDLLRARRLRGATDEVVASIEPEALRAISEGLLLEARGLPRAAAARWEGLSETEMRFPLAAGARAHSESESGELLSLEERMLSDWAREPSFTPSAEVDALLFEIGAVSIGGTGAGVRGAEPSAIGVLGNTGLLEIRVVGP